MARGDKNYNKIVRTQKGKKPESKRKAIHNMVEALIAGDSDIAADHLHRYLQLKTRELILGERFNPDMERYSDREEDLDPEANDIDIDDEDLELDGEEDLDLDDEEFDDDGLGDDTSELEDGEYDDLDDEEDLDLDDEELDLDGEEDFDVGRDRFARGDREIDDLEMRRSRRGGMRESAKPAKNMISGNSLKSTPKKSNDTQAKKAKTLPNQGDTAVKGNVYTSKPNRQNLTKAKKARILK